MVTWKSVSEQGWDAALRDLPEATAFQSGAWGRFKGSQGWTPVRLAAAGSDDAALAMAQVMFKRLPARTAIAWCRGGPAGRIDLLNAGFRSAIREAAGARRLYVRFDAYRPAAETEARSLRALGWSRPTSPMNSGRTLSADLRGDEQELLSRFSSNWRRNLKRSGKRAAAPYRWNTPSSEAMAAVYREMAAYKGIRQDHAAGELEAMLRHFAERMVLYRCDGPDGRPLGLRACAIFAGRAWDLLAATTPKGRKGYASYALLWALLKHAKRAGAASYDLGGVDPVRAKGVYDFKRGAGGTPVEHLGEWDWASSGWLRPAANAAIRWKLGSGG